MTRGPYEPSGAEISLGRRMNKEGSSLQEVHEALGWDCGIRTTAERFKRYGIHLKRNPSYKRAHDGDLTTMSHGDERIDGAEGL